MRFVQPVRICGMLRDSNDADMRDGGNPAALAVCVARAALGGMVNRQLRQEPA